MSGRPGLVIWGASGHASVVADIVRLQGEFELLGFLDDVSPGRRIYGATILGGRERLATLRDEGVAHLIVAIGDCDVRLRLAEVGRQSGFGLARAIHPRSVVAGDAVVGEGSVIAAGAVVGSAARIGANAIVNTCASVDHGCIVGDGVHLSPGVHLGGGVAVGEAAWIGIGAAVADRVAIGARSVVGAGAVVLEDVPEGVVAWGVPARVVRERGSHG